MRTLVIGILALVAACLPAHAADEAKGRADAHRFKDLYWKCLADETVKVVPRKMSAPDFAAFITGRCPDQKKQFRIALIDYLALKHPEITMATHFTAADDAIKAAIDDVASAYVDLKTR